jgi:hypothetical protein
MTQTPRGRAPPLSANGCQAPPPVRAHAVRASTMPVAS